MAARESAFKREDEDDVDEDIDELVSLQFDANLTQPDAMGRIGTTRPAAEGTDTDRH